jgi:hypothetical protein
MYFGAICSVKMSYRKVSGIWKDFQERIPLENVLIGTDFGINAKKEWFVEMDWVRIVS